MEYLHVGLTKKERKKNTCATLSGCINQLTHNGLSVVTRYPLTWLTYHTSPYDGLHNNDTPVLARLAVQNRQVGRQPPHDGTAAAATAQV